VFLDFVQPDNAITIDKEVIPNKKAKIPIILGIVKLLSMILPGYPRVVIITIFVIANTVIRKQPAATVVDFSMLIVILLSDLKTNKLAITAIENPLNKEETTIS